VYHIITRN